MKTLLLLALVLLTGQAMACPDDAGKNAMAPTGGKAVTAAPAAPSAKAVAATPAAKAATTKVAAKPATEPRKTASL